MKILAINGSHDKNGDIAYLIDIMLSECRKLGADTEVVYAIDAVNDAKTPFCVNCSSPCSKQCYKDTYLDEVFDKMASCDAIIVGSPVYFGSLSGQLKCLFDKTKALRASGALTGKIGVAVTSGASRFGGQEATLKAIHDIMYVEGMTVVGSASYELGAGHHGVCAQSPAKDDEFAISRCIQCAHRIVEQLTNK